MDYHDPVSSVSHLFAAFVAAAAAVLLVRVSLGRPRRVRASLVVYGAAVVGLYLSSGLFHGLDHPTKSAERAWQRVDRTMICALIVASGLPLLAGCVPTRSAAWVGGAVTGAGLVGVAALWLLPSPGYRVTVVIYVTLTLALLVPLRSYYRHAGVGVGWLVGTVTVYATGAACDAAGWPVLARGLVGPHEVMHATDLGGTVLHYVFLAKYVALPGRAGPRPT